MTSVVKDSSQRCFGNSTCGNHTRFYRWFSYTVRNFTPRVFILVYWMNLNRILNGCCDGIDFYSSQTVLFGVRSFTVWFGARFGVSSSRSPVAFVFSQRRLIFKGEIISSHFRVIAEKTLYRASRPRKVLHRSVHTEERYDHTLLAVFHFEVLPQSRWIF